MTTARIMLILLLLSGAATLQASELYDSIHERLALMEDVAAYKWLNDQPVEVPEREVLVIEQAVQSGLEQGVTVESSRRFFSAQIEGAKDIQECWFNRWTTETGPTRAPDLVNEIRPRLLELGKKINGLLATERHDESDFMRTVKTECLPEDSMKDIFDALAQVSVYPDRLTQVLDSGTLRVGTTGDYAPFSYSQDSLHSEDAAYTGIDIDLARSLAEHLKVELTWVRTSWPTLMTDLDAGAYDIAMSGVSRIPAREEIAYFSHAYHVGGKTPIARCTDKDDLSSLEAIDQTQVRVIVNPGGTNERFLDANIKRARKVLHEDNRTIFEQIVKGEADVMITDLIEAQLQSAHNTDLCMTMPGETLTYQEKAYMMPKDPGLLAVVNRWLKHTERSGALAETFRQHLETH